MTINADTNPLAAVWFAILGRKFLLHEYTDGYAYVLNDDGQIIGEAHRMSKSGGWSVHTIPFGGVVSADQIMFVSRA